MKILSVSMYSDIWVHSFPQHVVARELRDSGDQVLHLRCRGVLKGYCNAMGARGLKETATDIEKEEVCRSCRKRTGLLGIRSGMEDVYLEDQLTTIDRAAVDAYVDSVNDASWTEVKLEGISVARLSSYEFYLHHKLNSLTIPEELWGVFLGYVRRAALVLMGAKKVIDNWKPDKVLVYNALYGCHNVVVQYALSKGIESSALHAGQNVKHRYSSIAVYDPRTLPQLAYLTPEWYESKTSALEFDTSNIVTDHLLEIFKGQSRFVYSSPLSGDRDLKTFFGVPLSSQVLLATMSSLDEIVAAELADLNFKGYSESLYPRAVDWIDALCRYATSRPDCFVIIRVHPREFANKRETVLSQNAIELKRQLENLPGNMVVNWPSDDVSLYDLASITDVCLNFSSTAGIEMMALGIPTVVPRYDRMIAYDPGISHVADTENEYFGLIDQSLEEGWDVQNIRRAYRWWAFVFARVAVDISAAFNYPTAGYLSTEDSRRSSFRNAVLKLMAKWLPPLMELRDLARRYDLSEAKTLVRAVHESAWIMVRPMRSEHHDVEDVVLATQLSRLVEFFDTFGMRGVSFVEQMCAFIAIQRSPSTHLRR
jgi:hypothetical protein